MHGWMELVLLFIYFFLLSQNNNSSRIDFYIVRVTISWTVKIKHLVGIWEESSAINICYSGAGWPNVQERHVNRCLEQFVSIIIVKGNAFWSELKWLVHKSGSHQMENKWTTFLVALGSISKQKWQHSNQRSLVAASEMRIFAASRVSNS